MISILIVEDEPTIAKALKRIIEQYDSTLNVIAIAINGKRALDILEANHVDIVFSDIKMPIMNGIELSKEISEKYPHISVILTSGFQEFEYARDAIKYGVLSYLTKPIKREDIHEILDEIIEKINKKKSDTSKEYLMDLLHYDTSNIQKKVETATVILICAGAFPVTDEETMFLENHFFSQVNLEEEINNILQHSQDFICIPGKSSSEKFIVISEKNIIDTKIIGEKLFDKLNHIEENLKISVTMVVHAVPTALNEIGEIFRILRKTLRQEILLFKSQLIFTDTILTKHAQTNYSECKNHVILALKTKNEQKIETSIQKLVKNFVENYGKQVEILFHLNKLVVTFFDDTLHMNQIEEINKEIQYAITVSTCRDELSQELLQIFLNTMKKENEQDILEEKTICEEVVTFLQENYKKNITNSEISKKFGVSAVRLSKQFKDYFGVSVSEYLNKYRIETAQIIMRSDKSIKVKEVAISVGFNDQYYFSKTFKKYAGIWPTQYNRDME